MTSEAPPTEVMDRALNLLVELCSIASPTGDADGLREVAARLSSELARHGFSCEISEEPDDAGVPQPVLVATGPPADDGCILLVGHMDTVLTASTPRVQRDRLEGVGALDMKGGFAAFLGALDLLALEARPLPRGLTLLAVPDEEASGLISQSVTHWWGRRAKVLLVLEPGELRGDAESVVSGRRGLTEWQLEVVGTPAHSGLDFWLGRSALVAAAEWSVGAQGLSVRGSGPTVNVGRLVAGSTDFVDRLPESCEIFGSSLQRNVIPDRAIAEGELRYLSINDRDEVLSRLARLAETVAVRHELQVSFQLGISLPPVDPGRGNCDLVRRAVELAAARGFRLEVEEDRGGVSFPNYLSETSNKPVIDGLGPAGGGMHTREEWIDLRSLARRIVLLADLLEAL